MSDTIEKGKTEDELRRAIEERNHLYSLLEKLSEELTGVPVGIGTEAELLAAIRAMKNRPVKQKRPKKNQPTSEHALLQSQVCSVCGAKGGRNSFSPRNQWNWFFSVRLCPNHAHRTDLIAAEKAKIEASNRTPQP